MELVIDSFIELDKASPEAIQVINNWLKSDAPMFTKWTASQLEDNCYVSVAELLLQESPADGQELYDLLLAVVDPEGWRWGKELIDAVDYQDEELIGFLDELVVWS